jgi:hypothetical protein
VAPRSPALLRVQVGGDEIAAVTAEDLPSEQRHRLRLDRCDTLRFIDSQGTARDYALTSLRDGGARFLHLSVQIARNHGVQADGILTARRFQNPDRAFRAGASAVRFQPFFLPEAARDRDEHTGRTLSGRGLHFPGLVTPGNVSLLCVCDHCRTTFRLQPFHAGFSSLAYFYCSGGPHTLVVSEYEPGALERALPKCRECGGSFAYANPLRCPHCRQPYVDFARHPGREHYGHHLYGARAQGFAVSPPPVT